ncbi:MAG: hypothetical protein RIQ94_1836 [Pseudomonadota bacterium]
MSKSTILKKRVIYSLVTTVMAAASQGGFAHTRLESPTILEGSSGVLAHNRVTIGHGCPPTTAIPLEILAMALASCFQMRSVTRL